MSQRITGRVNGQNYEVLSPAGNLLMQVPLADARLDAKLRAAIQRNGWEGLDG